MVDLGPDILRRTLAELKFVLHLHAHMLDVVEDDGKGEADGQDGDDREGHRRIGDELIGTNFRVVHFLMPRD